MLPIDIPDTVAFILETLPILEEHSNNNPENGHVFINCAKRPELPFLLSQEDSYQNIGVHT